MEHRLFYCDHYAIPLPAGHRFPMAKYRMLRDLLAADGCFRFEAAPCADPAVVELAHEAAYVRDFLNGALPEVAIRRIGFPWSEALVRRTLGARKRDGDPARRLEQISAQSGRQPLPGTNECSSDGGLHRSQAIWRGMEGSRCSCIRAAREICGFEGYSDPGFIQALNSSSDTFHNFARTASLRLRCFN